MFCRVMQLFSAKEVVYLPDYFEYNISIGENKETDGGVCMKLKSHIGFKAVAFVLVFAIVATFMGIAIKPSFD